jgi:hypothetical protein
VLLTAATLIVATVAAIDAVALRIAALRATAHEAGNPPR